MKEISGTLFAYSYLCHRKLWYYSKDIVMEQESELVQIGKLIDENSYKRDKKHTYLDDLVCIDIVRNNVICEVKKSSSQLQMAKQQLKYYLYLLNEKGIKVTGELLVPKENKKEIVELTKEDIIVIENQLQLIKDICNVNQPPLVSKQKACKNCAYYELCYI